MLPMPWTHIKDQLTIQIAQSIDGSVKGNYYFSALEKYLPPSPRNFLSIGAGSGDTEIFLAKKLNCSFGFQDYSEELARLFKKRASEQKVTPLETAVGKFESCSFKNTYDLILSIHAWYYISIEAAVMKKLRDLLNSNGRVLVVLHRENNIVVGLNR